MSLCYECFQPIPFGSQVYAKYCIIMCVKCSLLKSESDLSTYSKFEMSEELLSEIKKQIVEKVNRKKEKFVGLIIDKEKGEVHRHNI